jgi:hypothetical protein
MAYVYLIDLHTLVEKRLAEAQEKLKNNGNDPLESRFEQGRIEILSDGSATWENNPCIAYRSSHEIYTGLQKTLKRTAKCDLVRLSR